MELKELCKECLLYCEKRHNCPFCDIDFSDRKKIIQESDDTWFKEEHPELPQYDY